MDDYKKCNEIKQLSPEIIIAWNQPIQGDIYLVRLQTMIRCPLDDKIKPETTCRSCSHHYGNASPREIYCLPETVKVSGGRQAKDRERRKRP